MPNIKIRPAAPADCAQILQFVTELAIYEKARHEVVTDEARIEQALFCDNPKAFALMCEVDGEAAGFALYFFNYSTWLGKHGIYLEDLYVSPEHRGAGAGKALLQKLAQIAVSKNCGRLEWSVLDWNEPAIKFYQSLEAKPQDEWIVYRLTGDALVLAATKVTDS